MAVRNVGFAPLWTNIFRDTHTEMKLSSGTVIKDINA